MPTFPGVSLKGSSGLSHCPAQGLPLWFPQFLFHSLVFSSRWAGEAFYRAIGESHNTRIYPRAMPMLLDQFHKSVIVSFVSSLHDLSLLSPGPAVFYW